MGIKQMIKRAGGRAADTVAKLAVLSPGQLSEIQKQRQAYLNEMPSMTDSAAQTLTMRLLSACGIEIYNEYLKHLQDMYVPIEKDSEYEDRFKPSHNIRYFNITQWVVDKNENNIEKLINVYQVLANEECNIALVFHRSCSGTQVYLGVVNTDNADDNVNVENYRKRLIEAIRGNFPGAIFGDRKGNDILPCLKNSLPYSVACCSNIPGEKSEKFASQTIEKLLDGIVPDTKNKEYTLILLATPIKDVEDRKLHLAELYTGLAPYAGWQTNYTYTESDTTNSSATFGVNAGVSAGIQSGQNASTSATRGVTDSEGTTATDSTGTTNTDSTGNSITESSGNTKTQSSNQSVTDTSSYSETSTKGSSSSSGTNSSQSSNYSQMNGTNSSIGNSSGTSEAITGNAGVNIGPVNAGGSYAYSTNSGSSSSIGTSTSETLTSGLSQGVSESATQSMSQATGTAVSQATGSSVGQSLAETTAKSIASNVGKSVAQNIGHAVASTLGKAVTKSVTAGTGLYKGVNFGGNFGANFARSSNVSATIGRNEGIQQSFTNYSVKHTLEILEEQMKRFEQSSALGMWDFAAYVLSEDQNVANNVAHTYMALTQGESSYLSQSCISLWRGDMGEYSKDAKEICSYLRELRHPLFGLSPALVEINSEFLAYPEIVTAATPLSGKELSYSLNFPKKSVAGFPVIECAEFGRNVVSYDGELSGTKLNLGSIFHMNHVESGRVQLSKDSLASHTFITGSTGSGKSNTVYELLNEAIDQGVHFLVIEPAKGEYKDMFGSDPEVAVFGTNPYLSPMLHINPFSFPQQIHIYEHLDRLVELFNVCWPMYAAMPAVLKSAIEKSYVDCGWDLMKSTNRYGETIYPTFADVANNIKEIIDASEYDAENKGAYKGSLLTRLQSLSTGIYGTIFVTDELSSEILFDGNVIVDLSRVGSAETKALIMGMLVLKLQEYRMTHRTTLNAGLRHITVLEEAHNLLRRTSTEQSPDSANLLGKSVEMLSNAIAEMRTYGEGFIIVDQAPGLLDMAAIRNTNTKIIMRLPDQGDRELVGRAANLNDDQIAELAKLPCGVAAVYQNEWVQPVLCKVDFYEGYNKKYEYTPSSDVFKDEEINRISDSLLQNLMDKELFRKGRKEDLGKIKDLIIRSKLSTTIKVDFIDYIAAENDKAVETLRKLLYDFLSAEKAIEASKQSSDITSWVTNMIEALRPSIKDYSKRQINLALALLLYEQCERDKTYNDLFCRFTEIYQSKGEVF